MSGSIMTEPVVCQSCGRTITGSYITAMGAAWHAEHFVCAECRRPIETDFIVHDGRPYHMVCHVQHVAPRCAYCNRPLTGHYLTDGWGTNYCATHILEYPACHFCGRLVPPSAHFGQPDFVSCHICWASAVLELAQAQPIFTFVVHWLTAHGLTLKGASLQLELMSRQQILALLSVHDTTSPLGVARISYHHRRLQLTASVEGIAIARGIPSTLFQGVSAHELGHAWLALNGVHDLPLWAEEGFCELLAYRCLSDLASSQSRYHARCIEQKNDPIYGVGFRRVRSLSDRIGFDRLVETLRLSRQLPSGV